MTVNQTYQDEHPHSRSLYERALQVFPSGVTHDSRFLQPFPPYVGRAQGATKWDVDGHDTIDYLMGHGALILGHQYPDVVAAVHDQLDKGTHFGACHELEVQWGEKVISLVPSAERVRFTSSGTEATLMAIRLARAYTGKRKIVRFFGHYHGWHDAMAIGVFPPFDLPNSGGIPEGFLDTTIALPPDDLQPVEELLQRDPDVAGVILEPSGGFSGAFPVTAEYLQTLRRITAEHGVVLIFDEVITGFRFSPGGAQTLYGVTPDLSCFAKILAGGLPGGAVAGKREIMEYLELREDPEWNRKRRILHPGTFNANPLSAAAGVATLSIIEKAAVTLKADQNAEAIRDGLNAVIDRHGIQWCAHGEHSIVHLLLNHECPRQDDCNRGHCTYDYKKIYQKDPMLLGLFRKAMLNHGVDSIGDHWWVSWMHTDGVIEETANAFDHSLRDLIREAPERMAQRA